MHSLWSHSSSISTKAQLPSGAVLLVILQLYKTDSNVLPHVCTTREDKEQIMLNDVARVIS